MKAQTRRGADAKNIRTSTADPAIGGRGSVENVGHRRKKKNEMIEKIGIDQSTKDRIIDKAPA